MSAINVNSITGRTGGHGPVLTGVTTVSDGNLVVIGTGRVGIGTSIPSSTLHLNSNTVAEVKLTLQNTNGTTAIYGNNDDIIMDADKYRIRDVNGSAEYIRIVSGGGVGINTNQVASGVNVAVGGTIRVQDSTDTTQYLTINHQGIDFQNTGAGSSTTASSHLLDDYEEGTWTPTLSSETVSNVDSRYRKIGSAVTLYTKFDVTSLSNIASGDRLNGFGGYPFSVASGSNLAGHGGTPGGSEGGQRWYLLTTNNTIKCVSTNGGSMVRVSLIISYTTV